MRHSSLGLGSIKALTNGNRRRSGGRSKVLFYIWSAGDVLFLVKSIVQCSDESKHKIA